MQVAIENLRESRQVVASAQTVCKEAGHKMGHSIDCCGCHVCTSKRLLDQVIQELGALNRPQLDEEYPV